MGTAPKTHSCKYPRPYPALGGHSTGAQGDPEAAGEPPSSPSSPVAPCPLLPLELSTG